jgi:hypothetical protein
MKRPGHPRVEPPARSTIDARTIRLNSRGVGSTQDAFAKAIGVSVKTLRNWEQRRAGSRPARPGCCRRCCSADIRCGQRQHPITPAAH